MLLASVQLEFAPPSGAIKVVGREAFTGDPKKYVVVHPFGQWADSVAAKDIGAGISHHAIHAPSQRQAEIIADIDCKLVPHLEVNDEARPLRWAGWDCSVSLRHVADRSLCTGG